MGEREFIVDKLVEGGATRGNITVLELMINPDVKMKGLYYRSKELMVNGGMTIGDRMRIDGWEGVGDATCAQFIEFQKKEHPNVAGNGTFEKIPSGYGKTVDVSGRDMTHLDGVDEALGLVGKRNNTTFTFEEIRGKVKVIDQKREEDMIANGAGEEIAKIIKKIMDGNIDDEDKEDDVVVATDTDEQNQIMARRSSLISV